MDKIVAARLAPWSKDGVIFGVPHDVHPVAIAYRDDLFREAGIDLPAARPGRSSASLPAIPGLLAGAGRAQPPCDRVADSSADI